MANNCVGVNFDASCDGSGNWQDSGVYLNNNDLPYCCGDVSQQGMSASNCRELASDIACGSLGGGIMGAQTQLSALSSQMVQKRRIPPLGPKATMRSASGSDGPRIKECPCLVEGLNSAMDNPTLSCNMRLYRSCRHCCRYYQNYGHITSDSANMRSATGGGKTKVATAVNWLTPLI